ncbi:MAG: MATE family efflux transporter [Lachnospiraceae bacterium]|nr:MATE family efflux transporter [Lachnospiraceae bacterium]
MDNSQSNVNNPLAYESVGVLLRKFAIPSIVAMLVTSLYNIVDQLFIGQYVGELGNAATNIVFPLSMCCISIALLFGIGGASSYNLAQGRGENDKAPYYIGTSVTMMIVLGLILGLACFIFTNPILKFLGSPDSVLDYANVYLKITSVGFPFMILQAGGGHIVRADGSPKITMLINIVGAVINVILDAIFIIGMDMGMAGAAAATIIGQIISSLIVIVYLFHFKTSKLTFAHFVPKGFSLKQNAALGTAPCFNQLAMMTTQILFNNSLKHYGAQSIYGDAIPIAVAGIVLKTIQLLLGIIIGISQGMQPIVSFNYGAKNYDRVKRGYTIAIKSGMVIALIGFALFQIFPGEIISLFGRGSELYTEFGIKFYRYNVFMIFLIFMQPISSNFFTSIGKPKKGVFLSLTRQFIFLIPLIIVLPMLFGLDGILFAQPTADLLAFVVCLVMIVKEFKKPEYKDTESFFIHRRKNKS